jgi:hypothetical protein
MSRWFAVPVLTRGRIWFAYAVAVATDTVQLLLGPLGWAFVDEGLDVIAMILTTRALGFHMLLLPTFVVEFIPIVDMLPTWTACTAAVILLRKRAQAQPSPAPPPIDPIDISSEVRRAPAREQPDGKP